MQYKNKLFLVDKDGNEHELLNCNVDKEGEILTNDIDVIIEKELKIISK
ncbi:hypothetical protein [Acinetobacter sp. Root1280]|nr:hypothetical protein [Acinetobacter sp. Root1280]